MDRLGLRILRRNMQVFINADPITVVLHRDTIQSTDNGGYKKLPFAQTEAQKFRRMPFTRRQTNFTTNTQDGDIPVVEFLLIGAWNANIQRWDEFTLGTTEYIVISVEMASNDQDTSSNDRKVALVAAREVGLAWQRAGSSS